MMETVGLRVWAGEMLYSLSGEVIYWTVSASQVVFFLLILLISQSFLIIHWVLMLMLILIDQYVYSPLPLMRALEGVRKGVWFERAWRSRLVELRPIHEQRDREGG